MTFKHVGLLLKPFKMNKNHKQALVIFVVVAIVLVMISFLFMIEKY